MNKDWSKTEKKLRELLGDSPAARLLIELDRLRAEVKSLKHDLGVSMAGRDCEMRARVQAEAEVIQLRAFVEHKGY